MISEESKLVEKKDTVGKITGSCLCGLIKFEISLPSIGMINCHCSRCRKASGAAFGTFLHTTADFFKWIEGDESIINFIPTKGDPRPFCKQCGSHIPVVNREKNHVIIPAGLLDEAPDLVPSVHLYIGSKAEWHSIQDNLPTFYDNAPDEFWKKYFIEFQEKLAKNNG